MRVALFCPADSASAPKLAEALGRRMSVQTLDAPSEHSESESHELAGALVAFESMLVADPPAAVLIGGGGPAALAAVLAAAKLGLPIGRVGAGEVLAEASEPGAAPAVEVAYGRLVDRLAATRFCAGEPELAALSDLGLAQGTIVAGASPEGLVSALITWLDQL